MRKIFLITLALLMIGSMNLFDTSNLSGRGNFNLADAQEVEVTENFAEEVLQLVNIEREKVGAKPLQLSPELSDFADVRVKELPENFSHKRPDGSKWSTAITVSYREIGENIAAGQRTPEAVVTAWMNSEGHRKNILNDKFGKLGVGYFYAPETEYEHYWVQLFKD